MAREVTTFGNVDPAGKLNLLERDQFAHALGQFAGQPVSVTVKRLGKKRTSPANRYYRGVVVPLLTSAINEAWGEQLDDDEVHELLKRKFNARKVETENGYVKIAASTTRLDTAEFAAYVETIRQWAAEFFGIDIPDPQRIDSAQTELRA